MMKVVIIEDEKPAALKLKKELLQLNRGIVVDQIVHSVKSAIAYFEKSPDLDLIFMDIELSDGRSFEILNEVRISSPIVFITAYDQYWQRALSLNGIDYLLKPSTLEELERVFVKYDKIKAHFHSKLNDFLSFISNDQKRDDYKQKFLIRKGRELVMVESSDVAYLKSTNKMTLLVTHEGRRLIIDESLTTLDKQLDPNKFTRASRSHIINIAFVNKISMLSKGKMEVQMISKDGECIYISQERSSAFKKWLES